MTTATDDTIRTLRAEAAQAGDIAQCAICDLALGETRESYPIGIDLGDMTAEQARAECARVIDANAARSDRTEEV